MIMVYLAGGLAHQDTFDLKPDAPAGIRGEFKPIATRLPGVQIGELLPRMAGVIDKVALIRSIVGLLDEHSSFQNLTGFPMAQSQREGKPNFGSVIARMQGPVDPLVPPFVDLFPVMQHRPYNSPGTGLSWPCLQSRRVWTATTWPCSSLPRMSPADDSIDRRGLFDQFDQFRRRVDNAEIGGMDDVYRRAFDVLTSDKVAKALDVSREDPKLRDRYGLGSSQHLGDGAPMWNDQLLIARRLVEAGHVVSPSLMDFGIRTARTSVGSASICPCSTRGSPPWLRIFTPAAWTATSRSSSGASSAAPPRSTRTPGAITGHASTRLSCAAEA